MDVSSYTAASTLPKKLLIDKNICESIKNHNIKPIHIQLNPTNKCPLTCSFCSCKNRDKKAVMSIEDARNLIDDYHILGTKAVTITGGGDPLAYPHLKELLEHIKSKNMVIGLVTNGILFNKIDLNILKNLTWCRISVSDEQILPKEVLDRVIQQPVEWAFSYVLSNPEDITNLLNCIQYANDNNFTHVRLVDNILTEESNNMDKVKKAIRDKGIDDKLVIYQGRKKYSHGHKRCFISLLKPNIDPEGNMLPCCGIQYAFDNPAYNFEKEAIMNKGLTTLEIYEKQLYFDGSKCVKCYYSDYNELMNMLWDADKVCHKEFV